MHRLKTSDIRMEFASMFDKNQIADNDTLEIINASFIADDETIFGTLNRAYATSELHWYWSMSLDVNDIRPEPPSIWKQIASDKGKINSNYGWCIYSMENHNQFDRVVEHLEKDINSRQAVMIYIRPSMHKDAVKDGMKDFMCTYATQFLIRDGLLNMVVYMRSNDAIFGYKNDLFWQKEVQQSLLRQLHRTMPDLELGPIYWNAASLHIYRRHFYLVGDWIDGLTGKDQSDFYDFQESRAY